MNTQFDPIALETRYEILRSVLRELSDLLVHSSDDERVLEVFRAARGTATQLFEAEERALEELDTPLLEVHRQGHRRFLGALEEVQREADGARLGIHAAGLLRRELLPWLHEHHALVDRQLLGSDSDFPGSPFRRRIA